MIMGKEGLRILENLKREEVRIYNDAADCGVPYSEDSTNRIREAVKDIEDMKQGKNKGQKGDGIISHQAYFLPVERNDYDRSKIDGIWIELHLIAIPARHFVNHSCLLALESFTLPGYYTITITRKSMPEQNS